MRLLQRQEFPAEIEYLKEPMRNQEPMRVRTLHLFLDSDGLIRSRGRLNRSSHLAYEVKNPILLGKHHPVTKLVIVDRHVKCSHFGNWSNLG